MSEGQQPGMPNKMSTDSGKQRPGEDVEGESFIDEAGQQKHQTSQCHPTNAPGGHSRLPNNPAGRSRRMMAIKTKTRVFETGG